MTFPWHSHDERRACDERRLHHQRAQSGGGHHTTNDAHVQRHDLNKMWNWIQYFLIIWG